MFSSGKTSFFMVNIANFIHYFIFIWIFQIMFAFFSTGILTICFLADVTCNFKGKNNKWPVEEDYSGFSGSNRGSCYKRFELKENTKFRKTYL